MTNRRICLLLFAVFALVPTAVAGARAHDTSSVTAGGTCSDGTDNDGDGLIDADDPDCDEGEVNITQCNDDADNDSDGLTDFPADPGCKSPGDNAEADGSGEPARCSDGVDNDGDGLTDSADPDCDKGVAAACADGIDNDQDGLTDAADPDCKNAGDNSEAPPLDSCADGQDNDGDGLTDEDDPDCDEGAAPPECSDGVDNDGDGDIDFPADDGCTSADEDDETGDPTTEADPCTTEAADPGLLGNDTIAQQLWDSGVLGPLPLFQDPDADGPISGPIYTNGNGTPLEVVTDEVGCAVNLPIADL